MLKPKRKNTTPNLSRVDQGINWIKNHKVGSIIIIVGIILSSILALVGNVADLIAKLNSIATADNPNSPIAVRDTLTHEIKERPTVPAFDSLDNSQRVITTKHKNDSLKRMEDEGLTLSVTFLTTKPVPMFRATVMNHSNRTHLVMGLKVDVKDFMKSRSLPEAQVLDPLAVWIVDLDTTGVYVVTAKKPIRLPPDTPAVIDLAFVCESNQHFYKPKDVGKFVVHLSFITDTRREIKLNEDIKI